MFPGYLQWHYHCQVWTVFLKQIWTRFLYSSMIISGERIKLHLPQKGPASLNMASSSTSSSTSSLRLRIISLFADLLDRPDLMLSPRWGELPSVFSNAFYSLDPVSLRITHRPRAERAFHHLLVSAPWSTLTPWVHPKHKVIDDKTFVDITAIIYCFSLMALTPMSRVA